jgi:cysteine-rich repeat protein
MDSALMPITAAAAASNADSTIYHPFDDREVDFDEFCVWGNDHPLEVSTRCGDGVVDEEEECDDGNTAPHDGCSPGCHIEPTWECTSPALPGSVPLAEFTDRPSAEAARLSGAAYLASLRTVRPGDHRGHATIGTKAQVYGVDAPPPAGPSVCTNPPPDCSRALELAYELSPNTLDPAGDRIWGATAKVAWNRSSTGTWAYCFRDGNGTLPTNGTARAWMRIEQNPPFAVTVTASRVGDPAVGTVPLDSHAKLADAEANAVGDPAGRRTYRIRNMLRPSTPEILIRPGSQPDNTYDTLVTGLGIIRLVTGTACTGSAGFISLDTCDDPDDNAAAFRAFYNMSLSPTLTHNGNYWKPEDGFWPDSYWNTSPVRTTNNCQRTFTNHYVGTIATNASCYGFNNPSQRCWNTGINCPVPAPLDSGAFTPNVHVDANGIGTAGTVCTATNAGKRAHEASCTCTWTCSGLPATGAIPAGAGCGCGIDICDADDCGIGMWRG